MLESQVTSVAVKAKPIVTPAENSKQQSQGTKCAKFGRYSLYALPTPTVLGFLSHVAGSKCGIGVFGSAMCSTGVAASSFIFCSIMYSAHSCSEKKIKVENEAKPSYDSEGYIELLQQIKVIDKQPESNIAVAEVSIPETTV
jgi:hypothetical protein